MTLSKEKIDAFAQLEEAIQNITRVFKNDGEEDLGWMVTGWLLVTNEVRLPTPDEIEENPDYDELDYRYVSGCYSRRGQEPVTSLGLAHEYIRHYNSINE